MDTIFALASAPGKAGVSIVRISGPAAWSAVRTMTGELPEPRKAGLRSILLDGELLDHALILLFEHGKSFSGEEVAEIHLHGSPATVRALLRYLGDLDGLRLAEAGEFSRRALENGCLDLAQIEGLGDLIEAETESQRRQALRIFSGALGARVAVWRQMIIEVSALIAAGIDFADEEIPADLASSMLAIIDKILVDLRTEIDGVSVSERIRDGFEVAIVGAPNVGKSTLLNMIAGREAAITSELAGTTRDVIEVRLDISGFAVTLLDTAGLRESGDLVEGLGIARAMERALRADLRIFLTETGVPSPEIEVQPGDMIVVAKSDISPGDGLRVSGLTGEGVAELLARIGDVLSERSSGAATITRERHRRAVMNAFEAMEMARLEVSADTDRTELAAEYLRAAAQALDVLIGKVEVDDILGEIFARFCVGK